MSSLDDANVIESDLDIDLWIKSSPNFPVSEHGALAKAIDAYLTKHGVKSAETAWEKDIFLHGQVIRDGEDEDGEPRHWAATRRLGRSYARPTKMDEDVPNPGWAEVRFENEDDDDDCPCAICDLRRELFPNGREGGLKDGVSLGDAVSRILDATKTETTDPIEAMIKRLRESLTKDGAKPISPELQATAKASARRIADLFRNGEKFSANRFVEEMQKDYEAATGRKVSADSLAKVEAAMPGLDALLNRKFGKDK